MEITPIFNSNDGQTILVFYGFSSLKSLGLRVWRGVSAQSQRYIGLMISAETIPVFESQPGLSLFKGCKRPI
jgi:hypothetical protein